MEARRRQRGWVLWGTVTLGALALSLGAWWLAASAPASAPPAPDTELVDALLRTGLGPEELTAAGVPSDQVDEVVATVAAHLAQDPDALSTADGALFEAQATHDPLRRKVRSGLATDDEKTAFEAAKTALANAKSARESVLAGIIAAAEGELTQSQATALDNLRSNASWGVPLEFKVSVRTQEQWVALRAAWHNEKIAAKYDDEEVDASCASLLSDCRAEAAVAAAKVSLDTSLSQVESAWDSACAD